MWSTHKKIRVELFLKSRNEKIPKKETDKSGCGDCCGQSGWDSYLVQEVFNTISTRVWVVSGRWQLMTSVGAV